MSDWVARSRSQLCDDNSCIAVSSSVCIISTNFLTLWLNSMNFVIGRSGRAVGNLDRDGVILKRDLVSIELLGSAKIYVQYRAVSLNSSMSSICCLATTASCGSFASGTANSVCRDNKTVRMVIAAAHWSLRMSKHIAPVAELILGCQIRVMNFTWSKEISWDEWTELVGQ